MGNIISFTTGEIRKPLLVVQVGTERVELDRTISDQIRLVAHRYGWPEEEVVQKCLHLFVNSFESLRIYKADDPSSVDSFLKHL